MKNLLLSFLLFICYNYSYAQVGYWNESLKGSATEGSYNNYKFILPEIARQEPHGLALCISDGLIGSTFFQMSSMGKLTFGPIDPAMPAYLNFRQGTYVYASINTEAQNLNFNADRTIRFFARDMRAPQLEIEGNVANFYSNLVIKPYSNTSVGAFYIQKGAKDDITIASTYDKWLRVSGTGGIALWGDGDYTDTNPTMFIGKDHVVIGGYKEIKQELTKRFSLFVTKGVLATDYAIAPTKDWADFVFDDSYSLMKLNDVERFIKENKHLPDMISEKEVTKNGYSQHFLNKKLLQKVEELTLYVIEQEKEIKKIEDLLKE